MNILLLIVSMAVITFACRALPLVLLAGRPLNQAVLTYLRYLPISVLAAVALASVWPQGRALDLPFLVGTGTAAVLAAHTSNLLLTLLGAMAVTAILRAL